MSGKAEYFFYLSLFVRNWRALECRRSSGFVMQLMTRHRWKKKALKFWWDLLVTP